MNGDNVLPWFITEPLRVLKKRKQTNKGNCFPVNLSAWLRCVSRGSYHMHILVHAPYSVRS